MSVAVVRLDDIVGEIVERQGGLLIHERGEGDSHFTVFDRCSDAVAASADLLCAIEAEKWPSGIVLRVRAAVHAGEVNYLGDGYYGTSVNRAARLRSLAHGGQALASRLAAELATDQLTGSTRLESLGLHRIRNWPEPAEVFQVCRDDLRRDIPPLNSEELQVPPMAAVVVVDVAGSSAFAREVDHAQLVARQRSTTAQLRDLFHSREGRFYQSAGDGCLAGFDTPSQAISFASQARSDLRQQGQVTRVGIDFGPVELLDGELSGHALFGAAELCKQGKPGNVVVSSIIRELVGRLNTDFESGGLIDLKSAPEPIEIYLLD